jgi:hypothetical protein
VVTPRPRRVSAGFRPALAALCCLLYLATPAVADTLYVNAGDSLQAALNAAQPGDEVVLAAGARFVGNFQLPAKPVGPVITIRSSASLPNRRITEADAGQVWFNGQLIRTSATVPVDVEALLRGLRSGTYPLVIHVSDKVGNVARLERTVTVK